MGYLQLRLQQDHLYLKIPGFVPFGANLTELWTHNIWHPWSWETSSILIYCLPILTNINKVPDLSYLSDIWLTFGLNYHPWGVLSETAAVSESMTHLSNTHSYWLFDWKVIDVDLFSLITGHMTLSVCDVTGHMTLSVWRRSRLAVTSSSRSQILQHIDTRQID